MDIAGFITSLLLTYYGYEAGQAQSEFTVTGIALMLTVFPGVFHALMGLVMFKYKITNDFYVDVPAQQGKTDIRCSKSGLSEENLHEQPLEPTQSTDIRQGGASRTKRASAPAYLNHWYVN